jgi:type II secretory pathway component PulK
LTVLVVVMLSSMLAASVLYAMRSEATAHTASGQREQGWTAAMSGVARALALATEPGLERTSWHDNPASFQHQFVGQDGDDQWFFTVYSASDSLGAEVRFGLTDESAKLSVLHHDPAWLRQLPSFGAALADVSPPTSPVASLEEWFALAGLSPRWLFGEDANYNLRLDPNEDDGDARLPLDDGNGLLDRGLQPYLTTVSYDLNLNHEGQPRVNLNDPDADLTRCGLPEATLDYLAALRRAGQSLPHPAALLEAEGEFTDAQGRPARLRSGIGREELTTLLDQCTATNATRLEGLVNVNTAPLAVLTALPFIGESLADTIVASRTGLTPDEAQTPAWLYRRGLVTADQFKEMAPHLTTRSRQFSFRSLGYALPSGRYRVLSVTLDVAAEPPRPLAVRDLTRFGFPVPLALLREGSAGTGATATAAGWNP